MKGSLQFEHYLFNESDLFLDYSSYKNAYNLKHNLHKKRQT